LFVPLTPLIFSFLQAVALSESKEDTEMQDLIPDVTDNSAAETSDAAGTNVASKSEGGVGKKLGKWQIREFALLIIVEGVLFFSKQYQTAAARLLSLNSIKSFIDACMTSKDLADAKADLVKAKVELADAKRNLAEVKRDQNEMATAVLEFFKKMPDYPNKEGSLNTFRDLVGGMHVE
jgi:hypothetical protein